MTPARVFLRPIFAAALALATMIVPAQAQFLGSCFNSCKAGDNSARCYAVCQCMASTLFNLPKSTQAAVYLKPALMLPYRAQCEKEQDAIAQSEKEWEKNAKLVGPNACHSAVLSDYAKLHPQSLTLGRFEIRDVDSGRAAQLGFAQPTGAYVATSSPTMRAGDVILKVGDQKISNAKSFVAAIQVKPGGSLTPICLLRQSPNPRTPYTEVVILAKIEPPYQVDCRRMFRQVEIDVEGYRNPGRLHNAREALKQLESCRPGSGVTPQEILKARADVEEAIQKACQHNGRGSCPGLPPRGNQTGGASLPPGAGTGGHVTFTPSAEERRQQEAAALEAAARKRKAEENDVVEVYLRRSDRGDGGFGPSVHEVRLGMSLAEVDKRLRDNFKVAYVVETSRGEKIPSFVRTYANADLTLAVTVGAFTNSATDRIVDLAVRTVTRPRQTYRDVEAELVKKYGRRRLSDGSWHEGDLRCQRHNYHIPRQSAWSVAPDGNLLYNRVPADQQRVAEFLKTLGDIDIPLQLPSVVRQKLRKGYPADPAKICGPAMFANVVSGAVYQSVEDPLWLGRRFYEANLAHTRP